MFNVEPRTQNHEPLPEEAYVMMGDHMAYTLNASLQRGFRHPVLACQFAKMLKIACGHPNTHAAASELDLSTLRIWAEEAYVDPEIIALITQANTAREIAVASSFDASLMKTVANHAIQAAALHAPGIEVQPLLCGYDGSVVNCGHPPIVTTCQN